MSTLSFLFPTSTLKTCPQQWLRILPWKPPPHHHKTPHTKVPGPTLSHRPPHGSSIIFRFNFYLNLIPLNVIISLVLSCRFLCATTLPPNRGSHCISATTPSSSPGEGQLLLLLLLLALCDLRRGGGAKSFFSSPKVALFILGAFSGNVLSVQEVLDLRGWKKSEISYFDLHWFFFC